MKIEKNRMVVWLLAFTLMAFVVASCEDDEEELVGDWFTGSEFDGPARSDAVCFTINGNAYLGTGYDGEDRLNDFWEYNTEGGYWIQKAVFQGVSRNGAVGFATSTKGYITTGYDGDNKLKDLWEYDPVTNNWTRKSDFMGSARYGAVAFSINNKGYVGTGYDDIYLKDFYEYDPTTDSWSVVNGFKGKKRRDAVAFVLNNKGYIVSGYSDLAYLTDFYCYDPSTQTWNNDLNEIRDKSDDDFDDDYTTISRTNAVAFTVNGKAYLAGGSTSALLTTVWEYNPTTDLWKEKTEFEGVSRTESVGFGIGNYGYIATGKSGNNYSGDLWVFDPTAEADEDY